MPYRRLPNTDAARIRAIYKALEMSEKSTPDQTPFDGAFRRRMELFVAEFDKNTGSLVGDYYEKPSYYAFGNICSVLDENVEAFYMPVVFRHESSPRINGVDCSYKDIIYGGLRKKNGSCAFVYWNSTNIVTTKDYESTTTFEISNVSGDIRLIDPITGIVYELPWDILKDNGDGNFEFKNIPIKDYPLIITFGEFID